MVESSDAGDVAESSFVIMWSFVLSGLVGLLGSSSVERQRGLAFLLLLTPVFGTQDVFKLCFPCVCLFELVDVKAM